MANVNEVDVAFVVDTTSSMHRFIDAAKRHMINLIENMSESAEIDMRVAIVQYRDHPPQDHSFAAKASKFMKDLDKARTYIQGLNVEGGGDGPESVWDGLVAASELAWRRHAMRLAILVGDAPPHGCGSMGDAWPEGCPCGEDADSTSAKLEEENIVCFGLGLRVDTALQAGFTKVSVLTGGQFFNATDDRAITTIGSILSTEFADVELDKKVFDAWDGEKVPDIAGYSEHEVCSSLSRLRARKLIDADMVPA